MKPFAYLIFYEIPEFFFNWFSFFSFLFSGHAQSVIGDSYALQSMERAQDWFSARRYHRVQETVAPLTTNSDALIAEQALYLQLMSAVYLSQKMPWIW